MLYRGISICRGICMNNGLTMKNANEYLYFFISVERILGYTNTYAKTSGWQCNF